MCGDGCLVVAVRVLIVPNSPTDVVKELLDPVDELNSVFLLGWGGDVLSAAVVVDLVHGHPESA